MQTILASLLLLFTFTNHYSNSGYVGVSLNGGSTTYIASGTTQHISYPVKEEATKAGTIKLTYSQSDSSQNQKDLGSIAYQVNCSDAKCSIDLDKGKVDPKIVSIIQPLIVKMTGANSAEARVAVTVRNPK
jgi:hypothetical protein